MRQKAKKIKEQATEVKQQLLAAETALNAFSDDEDYDKTIKEIHTIIAKIEQQTMNNYNYDEIEQNIADKREQLIAVEKLKSTLEFKLQQLNKLNKYFETHDSVYDKCVANPKNKQYFDPTGRRKIKQGVRC